MSGSASANAPHAFISYASVDRPRVQMIVDALTRAGIRTWLDQEAIDGGASYGPAIAAAIRGSAAMIVICTSAAMQSRNVRQEVAIAWRHQRPYVPLLLEPLTVLPEEVEYWLEGTQWIEVLDRSEAEWLPRVLRALEHLSQLGQRITEPAATSEVASSVFLVPTPLSPTVGREKEVAAISDLLQTTRLLTLTGPGGTGKTRLAMTVAGAVRLAFNDDVIFVDLSSLRDPDHVVPTIAAALEIPGSGDQTPLDSLVARLATRRLLLILDNLEQVVEAAASIVSILARCPEVRIIATSRISLRVSGEQEFPVEPLAIPDSRLADDLDSLIANDAVALFVQRARAVRPAFTLTVDNASAVAAICRRLDGLPLAIEIAAARCKVLTPAAMLARLVHPLELLVGGARDLPQRQQTIRATIEWSYNLLEPAEQRLLRRLGVFVGGWTAESAEAVVGPEDGLDVLDGLASLIDKNLVREAEQPDGEIRFGMLETIREFAQEALAAHREDDAYERHSAYFLKLIQAAEPALRGQEQPIWFHRLVVEQGNIRAMLSRSLGDGGDPRIGREAANALAWFWFTSNRFHEGRDWLQQALDTGPSMTELDHARLDANLGLLEWRLGKSPRAIERFQNALPVFERVGDRWNQATTLHQIAHTLEETDRPDEAIPMFERSIAMFEAEGDAWGVATTKSCLARSLDLVGRVARAHSLIQEALPALRTIGDEWAVTIALQRYGDIELALGEFDASAARYRESVQLAVENDDEIVIADALVRLAQISAALGQPQRAARLFGTSETIHKRHEITVFAPLRPAYDQAVANVRAALGNDEMTRLWDAGRRMSLEAAVNLALETADATDS